MLAKDIDKIKIVSTTYLHDYVVRFLFSDGKIHDLDFYPFLSKIPQNPMTAKYLNLDLFKDFEILDSQDISWNDYEMYYDFFTLYYGFEDGPKKEAEHSKNAPIICTIYLQKDNHKKITAPKVKRKEVFV